MGQVLDEQEVEEVDEEDEEGGGYFQELEVRAVEADGGLLEAEARKYHSVESHWMRGQEFCRKTQSRQKVGRNSWPGLTHGGRWLGEPQKRFRPPHLQMWLRRTGGSPTFDCCGQAWRGWRWQKLESFPPSFSASPSGLCS